MFFPLKMQHYNNIKETEMSFKKENSTFIGVLNGIDKSDRFNASLVVFKHCYKCSITGGIKVDST